MLHHLDEIQKQSAFQEAEEPELSLYIKLLNTADDDPGNATPPPPQFTKKRLLLKLSFVCQI
jgi:hypothetical protein